MNKDSYVSVIIPVRNASPFLDELLEALRRQTWSASRFEIIFVDNGSGDGTAERLEGVENQSLPPIRLLHADEIPSPYFARNRGMEAARGEIIALLDANKIPDPEWLEQGVKALTGEDLLHEQLDERLQGQQTGADLAGGEILFDLPENPRIGQLTDALLFNNNRNLVQQEGGSAAGNLFFRRCVWEKVGPFPEQFRSGMDIWWTQKAVREGYRLAFAEKAVVRCKPRRLKGTLRKAYRVGKVHPHNMRAGGMSQATIFAHALRTFGWPRPKEVRARFQRQERLKNSPFLKAWSGIWLVRIAMATGRLAGFHGAFSSRNQEYSSTNEVEAASTLAGNEPSDEFINKQRSPHKPPSPRKQCSPRAAIAYIYYTYYPVTGGASVHGYYLARELHRLGYRLLKINGQPDPFSEKWSRLKLSALLRASDLIYVRVDFFFNRRNLVGLLALLYRRNIVVELNCPSDELHLFGKSTAWIRQVDRIWGWFLKRADAVITVSEAVRRYGEEALGLTNVHVIENGGEVIEERQLHPSTEVKQRVEELKQRLFRMREDVQRIVIWSGTLSQLQSLSWYQQVISGAGDSTGFILVLSGKGADEANLESLSNGEENLVIFRNLPREDVLYLITQADIGLAFYDDYSWSRWGFYLSPLKIHEFLNNGLLTITNVKESLGIPDHSPNLRKVDSPQQAAEEILKFTRASDLPERSLKRGESHSRNMDKNKSSQDVEGKLSEGGSPSVRTWSDVAAETTEIFEQVLNKR